MVSKRYPSPDKYWAGSRREGLFHNDPRVFLPYKNFGAPLKMAALTAKPALALPTALCPTTHMAQKKDPLAGKGTHRKVVGQLFEKASPATKNLMAKSLSSRRERLRLEFKKNKVAGNTTDCFGQ